MFKQFIIDDLTAYRRGGARLMFWATLDQQAGIPDIVGCTYSRGLVIELKAEGTYVEELQRERLADWHHSGAIAGILREKRDHLQWSIGGHRDVDKQVILSRNTWYTDLLTLYLGVPKHGLRRS